MEKQAFEQTGLIPRSIIRTFDRFRKQLLPGAEKLIIQEFRISRYQVLVSVKCLLSLIIIPVLVNFLLKIFFLMPLTEYFWNTYQNDIFLNSYQQNRAFIEMQNFEDKIYFDFLISEKYSVDNLREETDFLFELPFNSKNSTNSTIPISLISNHIDCKENFNGFIKNSKEIFEYKCQKLIADKNYVFSDVEKSSIFHPAKQDLKNLRFVNVDYSFFNKKKTKKDLFLIQAKPLSLTNNEFTQNKKNHFSSTNDKFPRKQQLEFYRKQEKNSELLTNSDKCYKIIIFDNELNQVYNQNKDLNLFVLNRFASFYEDKKNKMILNSKNSRNSRSIISHSDRQSLDLMINELKHPPINLKEVFEFRFFFRKNLSPLDSKNGRFFKSIDSYRDNPKKFPFFRSFFIKKRNLKNQVKKPKIIFFLQKKDYVDSKNFSILQSKDSFKMPNEEENLIQQKFQEKTLQLALFYNQQSIEALTNLIGDFLTFGTISFLVVWMKPQIIILKSFLTESIYSLSDTTKSFLLILVTDLLVGFHSPHGWEIFLELVLRHFGLPENQEFVFLFVATFPVLLDTVFKYWIFRYLNQISPSTVATYHSMIE